MYGSTEYNSLFTSVFQVACIINKNSSDVINDLMANLKIGRGNSVDDIGFCMPLHVLEKHSGSNQESLMNNLSTNLDNMSTSKINPQNICIQLNKFDFINSTLKNNVVDKFLRPQIQKSKPRIIEFR